MWTLRWATKAERDYRSIPVEDRSAIDAGLDELKRDPLTASNVKALRNAEAQYRKRVRNWRIFFDVVPDRREVHILAIRRRNERTYR